jgi:hypothetical protein
MLSAIRTFALASSLILPFLAEASAGESCHNNMLRGHYSHLIQGIFGPADASAFGQTYANALPFQGIQMLEFDGRGGLTGSESLIAGGGELTNNNGKHFVPVVGSFTINSDCTGTAYICSNHTAGTISGGPNTCNANTIDNPGFLWEDFVAVTIVLAERGKKFHMLVIPPFDTFGIVRTISSTGTRVEDGFLEPLR